SGSTSNTDHCLPVRADGVGDGTAPESSRTERPSHPAEQAWLRRDCAGAPNDHWSAICEAGASWLRESNAACFATASESAHVRSMSVSSPHPVRAAALSYALSSTLPRPRTFVVESRCSWNQR